MPFPTFIYGGSELTGTYGVRDIIDAYNIVSDGDGLAATGIACSDQTVIAVACQVDNYECPLYVYRTTISTYPNWTQPTLPSGEDLGLYCNGYNGPSVATDGAGTWLIGLGIYTDTMSLPDYPNLLRSTDDGITWEVGLIAAEDAQGGRVNTLCYLGDSTFIAGCQNQPCMFRTTDGGVTWSPASTPWDTLPYGGYPNVNASAWDGDSTVVAGGILFFQTYDDPEEIYWLLGTGGYIGTTFYEYPAVISTGFNDLTPPIYGPNEGPDNDWFSFGPSTSTGANYSSTSHRIVITSHDEKVIMVLTMSTTLDATVATYFSPSTPFDGGVANAVARGYYEYETDEFTDIWVVGGKSADGSSVIMRCAVNDEESGWETVSTPIDGSGYQVIQLCPSGGNEFGIPEASNQIVALIGIAGESGYLETGNEWTVMYSNDAGATWTLSEDQPFALEAVPNFLAYGATTGGPDWVWMIGGPGVDTESGYSVYVSEDANSWSAESTNFDGGYATAGLIVGPGEFQYWVIAGASAGEGVEPADGNYLIYYAGYGPDFWNVWDTSSYPPSLDNPYLTAPPTFILPGFYTFDNPLVSTPGTGFVTNGNLSGVEWSEYNIEVAPSQVFGIEATLAVDYQTTLYSTDLGATWEVATTPLGGISQIDEYVPRAGLGAVAYGNGKWLAAGYAPVEYGIDDINVVSYDGGVTWTDCTDSGLYAGNGTTVYPDILMIYSNSTYGFVTGLGTNSWSGDWPSSWSEISVAGPYCVCFPGGIPPSTLAGGWSVGEGP